MLHSCACMKRCNTDAGVTYKLRIPPMLNDLVVEAVMEGIGLVVGLRAQQALQFVSPSDNAALGAVAEGLVVDAITAKLLHITLSPTSERRVPDLLTLFPAISMTSLGVEGVFTADEQRHLSPTLRFMPKITEKGCSRLPDVRDIFVDRETCKLAIKRRAVAQVLSSALKEQWRGLVQPGPRSGGSDLYVFQAAGLADGTAALVGVAVTVSAKVGGGNGYLYKEVKKFNRMFGCGTAAAKFNHRILVLCAPCLERSCPYWEAVNEGSDTLVLTSRSSHPLLTCDSTKQTLPLGATQLIVLRKADIDELLTSRVSDAVQRLAASNRVGGRIELAHAMSMLYALRHVSGFFKRTASQEAGAPDADEAAEEAAVPVGPGRR